MRISVIFLAGFVAAQTDPAGQCIQTCFAQVGQDNPDSPDITRCQALADGLLCLCRSTPLVDAFTTCTSETCPEFAAQVNGSAICQSSETGALGSTGSGDIGPSDTASGAGADPSNTASGVDAGPTSDTASGAELSNTAGGIGLANTDSAPAPTSGKTDAGNGVGAQGVDMVNFVLGRVALMLAGSLVI